MSATVWPLSVSSLRELVTSTTGASPETGTVSDTPPTCMSAFTVATKVPVSSIAWRLTVANPVSVKVSV